MAKIKVELSASYGCDCMGCGYGSEEVIEVEVDEQELEALRKLGSGEISCEAVVEAIESGDTTLQSLHEQLEEKFYYMVEEYWLYEAYNECLYECLADHIQQDISDGLYAPETNEDDGFDCHCWDGDEDEDEKSDDESESYGEDDEEDDEEDGYDLDAYYRWVQEHDHEFAAERVGLDLDACRDDEANYTITIE